MIKINKSGAIEINNVIPVEQFGVIQHYTTTISVRELVKVYERLTYDSEAQRGEVEGRKEIDPKHVKTIKEDFINGNSIRGHLTWNIRAENNEEDSDFDFDDNKLIIEENQLITMPDSAHRHEALKEIGSSTDDDSLLDSRFVLDIYNLDFDGEKKFFTIINGKGKPTTKNRNLYLSDDIECRILKDVIAKSSLKGKIDTVSDRVSASGTLTKFSTLYESLFGKSGVYKAGFITDDNYEEYVDWFSNFYTGLLTTREEFGKLKAKDKKDSRMIDKSMVLEEIAWWGYAVLAKEFKGNRKWRSSLKSRMNRKVRYENGYVIDIFNKGVSFWQPMAKSQWDVALEMEVKSPSMNNSITTRRQVKDVFEREILEKTN